ncbi:hypothetical protein [Xanthomonas nasturtii]|uniref:hypothetical protein n=1 Tax=Xanthomonas nasturtii TaxID=1843581 RepID=UPI0020133B12|nr:hypothetical protein [Xanthomonas nasturtii]MCL1560539.1 hypothetical protein [Xanthomonas nasturtii]
MREEELKDLARALGTLAATIEARDQRQHAALEREMAALRALFARNGDEIDRLVGGAVPQLQQAWQRALDSGLAPASRRLDAVISRSGTALQAVETAHEAPRRRWLTRAWLTCAGLIVATVLACASSVYLLTEARQDLTRYRLDAKVLHAVANSDVVLCGDRLCANIDLRGARSVERNQYRTVRPRP